MIGSSLHPILNSVFLMILSSFKTMALALSTIDDFVDVNIHSVGPMCIQCPKCLAFCFKKEKKIPFVVIMAKLLMNILITPLSI